MNIIFACLKIVFLLTIATEIGFFIQRSYCNIIIVVLSSLLAVLAGTVTFVYPWLSIISTIVIYFYCLCKFGGVKFMPDALLTGIIAIGGIAILYIQDIIKIILKNNY